MNRREPESQARYRLLSVGLIARCKIVRGANRTRARVPPISHSPSPLYRVSLNVAPCVKLEFSSRQETSIFFFFFFLFTEMNCRTYFALVGI